MAVDIGPRIGIDGEKEFRQQLGNINQQLRTLGSEMKAVTAEFDDNTDAQTKASAKAGVLNRQIDAQEQKLQELRKGLDASAQKYGETDTKTLKWQQSVNDATAELTKMRRELDKTNDELSEGGSGMDDYASALDNVGETGGASLGALKGAAGAAAGVAAVAAAVGALCSKMMELEESTREYRKIMGSLEVSSQAAGYTAEETAETYEHLYGVLGDSQTAATTVANLQAIGLSQTELTQLVDGAVGAWSRYGDSIPIDGLAEAINETVQTSKVTGTFADVLNWAGDNEDDFNAKLEACNDETERAQLVLDTLAHQGLIDAGRGWQDVNEDIVAANTAQSDWEAACARAGETVAPMATALKELRTGALNALIDGLDWAIAKWNELTTTTQTAAELSASVEAGNSAMEGHLQNAGVPQSVIDSALPTGSLQGASIGVPHGAPYADFYSTRGGQPIRVEVPVSINGREFARSVVPDLRTEINSNPEVPG